MAAQIDKLKQAAHKTAAAAKDKIDEQMLLARLARAHKQLGALVYTLHKTGREDPDMISWYVGEIDRLKARLDALRRPAQPAVSVYECPACGAGVAKDAMFCRRCGAQLP